jgi:dienelactone hydrolase
MNFGAGKFMRRSLEMRPRYSLLLSALLLLGAPVGCGDDPATTPNNGSIPPPNGWLGDAGNGDGDNTGDGDGTPIGDGDNTPSGDGDGDGDGTPLPDGGGQVGDGDGEGDGDGTGFIRGAAPSVESASKAGPYKVESTTMGLRDGTDYADATLWYPTDAEPPYALVAVVPGFVSFQQQVSNWGGFLASHGMVVITIGTNTLTDLPSARQAALLDALKTVEAENTRADSPLKDKLDLSRQATIGWSMGGGGSLLAAEAAPLLKAAISLAGWNPGYDYGKVTVPSLLLAVQTDALAGGQSQGFYDTIPEATPKLLWEADSNGAFFGGHDTFNDPASLEGAAGRYGLSWLKVFLEGDDRYRQFLKQEPPKKTDYKTNL